MLPKSRRIGKENFSYILTNGKRYNSPELLLYLAKINSNNEKAPSKFSFSISKKISPLAVNRNKYRRQGYSIINEEIKKIKSGYFLFFSFKKSSLPVTFQNLQKDILELLSVAGMLE